MEKYAIWDSFYNFAMLIDTTTKNKELGKNILQALAKQSQNKIVKKKSLVQLTY